MTELAAIPLALPRPSRAAITGRLGASLLALALLGVGFADLFNTANISFGLALAGGLALVAFLALTISHYDTASLRRLAIRLTITARTMITPRTDWYQ